MTNLLSDPLVLMVRKSLTELRIKPETEILVGVSGGVDSMALLSILHLLGQTIAAAHINFQLRGTDSDEDAMLVRKWCVKNNVPYFEHVADTLNYSEEKKLNIQSAAREIRYNWWAELVKNKQFDFVATAHHRDDAIETFLINLLRGSGMKGLTGIPAKRDYYIRPLLIASKAQIEAYAERNQIPFRIDKSNASNDYHRNKIRHHVIPILREYAQDSASMMDQTLTRTRFEWVAWDQAYQNWSAINAVEKEGEFFLTASEPEQPFLLRWLEEKGFPWPLTYDYVKATKAEPGKSLEAKSMLLTRTREGFYLGKMKSSESIMLEGPGTYSLQRGNLTIEVVSGENFIKNEDRGIEFINASVLKWPLQIREVLPGDHFQPLGMNGQTKTLQDFLVNLKLDNFEKRQTRILLSGENILWVVGRRLDERSRVTPNEKEVYKFTYVLEEGK